MNKSIKILLTAGMVLSLAGISGCETAKTASINAKDAAVKPAPDAGFIANPERQIDRANLPFQKSWIKPGFSLADYAEVEVSPVNTQYMQKMDWLHHLSSASWAGDVKADIASLAVYFRQTVEKEFRLDPNHRFHVLDIPQQHQAGQKLLRLELALIEIDPSTPVLNALGMVAPYGAGIAVGAVNQRRAAFEGRLRDVQTHEVVATFADRDMQDAGPLDVTRLTWYGPAKGIMDRWAQQFVEIANRKPGEAVRDPIPFTLRPF